MNSQFHSSRWPLLAGAILVFPCGYFLVASWFRFHLGVDLLWQWMDPLITPAFSGGWQFSMNILMVLSPCLAIIINIRKVLHVQAIQGEEHVEWVIRMNKYGAGWVIIFLSLCCLAAVALYHLSNNCTC